MLVVHGGSVPVSSAIEVGQHTEATTLGDAAVELFTQLQLKVLQHYSLLCWIGE